MSDFIYCPICDCRVGIDDASYIDYLPDEIRDGMKHQYKLNNNDMVCMECEINFNERD